MTIQNAAIEALAVQDACNLSGVVNSLNRILSEAIWPAAHAACKGTHWVNHHPVVTMFLLKLTELNGCCCGSLLPAYEVAEKACLELAVAEPTAEAKVA